MGHQFLLHKDINKFFKLSEMSYSMSHFRIVQPYKNRWHNWLETTKIDQTSHLNPKINEIVLVS